MVKVRRTIEGKICTKCGEFKPWIEFAVHLTKKDGHTYQCRDCDNKQKREYYQKNKNKWAVKDKLSQIRHPQKWKARAMVREAVRKGGLIKTSCEMCGELKVHAHHYDYSLPLNVMWLCTKHHMMLHRKYEIDRC